MKYLIVFVLSFIAFALSYSTELKTSTLSIHKNKIEVSKKNSKQIELKIKQRYISVDYRSKLPKVTYSPDSDRRASHYTHYVFSYDDFKEKVGDPEKIKVGDPEKIEEVTLLIEVMSTRKKKYTLEKNMPSPQGGFTHTYHRCRIIKKIK